MTGCEPDCLSPSTGQYVLNGAVLPYRPSHVPGDYDVSKVDDVHCFMCRQPIGDTEYREDRMLARFGQMMFLHVECPEPLI